MIRELSLVALLTAGLTACSKPLPEVKLNYAGEWRSQDMELVILTEGTVAYTRQKGRTTITVNGPIKEFVDSDFVVGLGPMKITFTVTELPHKLDGSWVMTVDCVQLTRSSD